MDEVDEVDTGLDYKDDNLKDEIIKCLSQQLSEMEMLTSMYPQPGEIKFTDNHIVEQVQHFINGVSENTPPYIDFVLNLVISEHKLEVLVTLPTFYPAEEPEIYIRCGTLNRRQQSDLAFNLLSHIREIPRGEMCLYTIILWLIDNVPSNEYESVSKTDEITVSETRNDFARLWIYSHHIYNKRKRDAIVTNAKDFKLNGFCLPGKPGVICIEGNEKDCYDWWKTIKAMNWQKIVIKKTELFPESEIKEHQKFSNFQEIHFKISDSSSNSKHMDMGSFAKYMENLNLGQIFNEIFGLS